MIDTHSADLTGWARFSDDLTKRYRLGRSLTGEWFEALPRSAIAVFLLLNPSKADAHRLDPTVKRTLSFGAALGASGVEVVNIFAHRATDPGQLYGLPGGGRGDDSVNDSQIVEACTGAHIVIAGWGVHGALDRRGDAVRALLVDRGISVHHLGLNTNGSPKHPLYIKGGTAPSVWQV
jgi:hypothetical protein